MAAAPAPQQQEPWSVGGRPLASLRTVPASQSTTQCIPESQQASQQATWIETDQTTPNCPVKIEPGLCLYRQLCVLPSFLPFHCSLPSLDRYVGPSCSIGRKQAQTLHLIGCQEIVPIIVLQKWCHLNPCTRQLIAEAPSPTNAMNLFLVWSLKSRLFPTLGRGVTSRQHTRWGTNEPDPLLMPSSAAKQNEQSLFASHVLDGFSDCSLAMSPRPSIILPTTCTCMYNANLPLRIETLTCSASLHPQDLPNSTFIRHYLGTGKTVSTGTVSFDFPCSHGRHSEPWVHKQTYRSHNNSPDVHA